MNHHLRQLSAVTTVLFLLAGCSKQPLPVEVTAVPAPSLVGTEAAVANAIDGARTLVQGDLYSARAWGTLGMVLQAHDFVAEAVACYQQASQLDNTDYRWPYLSALTRRVEQPVLALNDFRDAVQLDPDNAAVHIYFGDTLLEQANFDAAERQYRLALAADSTSDFAEIGLARVELLQDQPTRASERLETVVARSPRIREAHTLLSRVAARLGEFERSELHQGIATSIGLSSAPPDPAYLQVAESGASATWASRRGLRYSTAGRYDAAEREYRHLIQTAPSAQAHAGLALCLAAQGQPAEALDEYRRALELDPNEQSALSNLGQLLLAQGQLSEADEVLTRALQVDPFLLEAHLNLALVRRKQRRLEDSLRLFDRALELRPADIRALNQRAQVLTLLRRSPEAVESWLRSMAIDQNQVDSAYNLAVALTTLSRHEEAIPHLRRALGTAPNSSRISLFLAWQLATAPDATLRNGAEAVALASRVRRGYPQMAQAADVLSAAHAEAGDFAAAISEINAAIALSKDDTSLGHRQRLALYQRGLPFRAP